MPELRKLPFLIDARICRLILEAARMRLYVEFHRARLAGASGVDNL